MAYTDAEMHPKRLDKIQLAAQIASGQNPVTIVPIIVDTRRKESASNLSASNEDRDQLHERVDTSNANSSDTDGHDDEEQRPNDE